MAHTFSFGFVLAACLSFSSLSARVAEAQALKTDVPSVFLMDAATHTVLFAQGADAPVEPASTAKIMTADLAFSLIAQGKIHFADMYKVSENAWRTGGAPSRGSAMFAAVNSMVSVEDLVRGLTVVSGNDAAIALAEGIAGSESAFVDRMNARARELGLTHLQFRSVWGKDEPDQRVNAREMAELADDVISRYPDLYKFYGQKDFTWNRVHQYNRDPLLSMEIGADGLLTGFIKGAGYDLVGSAVQNGQRLILAMYGAKSAKQRAEEARKILDWGFRTFQTKTLFKAGETIGYASVFGGSQGYVALAADGPVNLLTPRKSSDPLSGHILYTGPVPAPVAKGAQIATLEVKRGDSVILDIPLHAAETVEVGDIPRRAADAALELGIGAFRKFVLKE